MDLTTTFLLLCLTTITHGNTVTRTRPHTLDSIFEYFERNRQPEPEDCPDCARRKELEQQIDKAEMDRIRIEIIKSQILRKLQMDAPPNITLPLDKLPAPIELELEEDYVYRDEREEQNHNNQPSEIYVFPEGVSPSCYTIMDRPMVCFRFHFDSKIQPYNMDAAEFWAYKLPDVSDSIRGNQTLALREVRNPTHHGKKSGGEIATITTTKREGWVKFDLKVPVYRWLRTLRYRTKGIEIICKTCQNMSGESPVGAVGQHKPFIKIVMQRRTLSRHKRSPQCSPTVRSCCMEPLYVDFMAIGWHWVRSPPGYYANYCRGSCRELIGVHEYHVSRVLSQVASHTTNQQLQPHLAACCAPTNAAPLDLVHIDPDGNNLIKRTLPNMIINSCGCL